MKELKECPFCGGKAEKLWGDGWCPTRYGCWSCQMFAKSAKRWNTRKQPKEQAIKRCKEEADKLATNLRRKTLTQEGK